MTFAVSAEALICNVKFNIVGRERELGIVTWPTRFPFSVVESFLSWQIGSVIQRGLVHRRDASLPRS